MQLLNAWKVATIPFFLLNHIPGAVSSPIVPRNESLRHECKSKQCIAIGAPGTWPNDIDRNMWIWRDDGNVCDQSKTVSGPVHLDLSTFEGVLTNFHRPQISVARSSPSRMTLIRATSTRL
ncbi:hypothetical protein DFH06DRAFT_1170627 [Mycena polygramma]|nr:hypothetical protein DFH06DRAFT_1170627 [Mycena polygramma]